MDKFTPEYIQNVQQIIKNDEKDKARELLKDLHPADIAELYQQLNLDEAEYIYMLLDGEKAADVLLELDEDDREKMLKQLQKHRITSRQCMREGLYGMPIGAGNCKSLCSSVQHMSFRQILLHTALKILARHQVCLRIFALSATKLCSKIHIYFL